MNPYSWDIDCLEAVNLCNGGVLTSGIANTGIGSGNPPGSVNVGAGEIGCPPTVDWFWILAALMGAALLVAKK